MDQFRNFGPIAAILKFWDGLSSAQKATLAAFMSLTIVLLVVVSVVISKPTMAVLFSGLEPEDASAIAQKLQDQKIPYEITNGGSVIKVPAKQLYDLRLQMAGAGLPQGGTVGFEIFDKSALGMTSFAQKMNYQRALQGELSKTIAELSPVMEARVHLAIPEERLFTESQDKPSASVVVKLHRGATLNDNQVSGIVHLVASSVQGMAAENVTLVDSLGNVLFDGSGESGAMAARLTAKQADARAAVEKQIQTSIQTMLDKVLGSGKAVVRVNATLNFDRTEATNELYEPIAGNRGILRSEQTLTETYGPSGAAASAGNAVGVAPNIRGPVATTTLTRPGGREGSNYVRSDTTAQYEVSRKIEQTTRAPGQIQKLNVAVLLDGSVPASQMSSIRQAVEAAAGIDITRGDKLVVESTPFDNEQAKKEEKELAAQAAKSNYLNIAKNVGAILLILGMLFFLRSLFKQVNFNIPEPVAQRELGTQFDAVSSEGMDVLVQDRSTTSQSNPNNPTGEDVEVYAQGLAKNQPEEVAQLLRNWMNE